MKKILLFIIIISILSFSSCFLFPPDEPLGIASIMIFDYTGGVVHFTKVSITLQTADSNENTEYSKDVMFPNNSISLVAGFPDLYFTDWTVTIKFYTSDSADNPVSVIDNGLITIINSLPLKLYSSIIYNPGSDSFSSEVRSDWIDPPSP